MHMEQYGTERNSIRNSTEEYTEQYGLIEQNSIVRNRTKQHTNSIRNSAEQNGTERWNGVNME